MVHQVKFDLYEGPIDLLLYLVKRGEIDIFKVPLAKIAEEYMEYVRLLEVIDLAGAGEFIAMAVSLLRLKLQMLFPSSSESTEDIEVLSSFSSEEYSVFRELADEFAEMEAATRGYFSRPPAQIERESYLGDEELSFFDLVSAFKAVIEAKGEARFYPIPPLPRLTIEEKMAEITEMLKETEKGVPFPQLFHGGRMELVTTFLAILELLRLREIRVVQPRSFDEILVYLGGRMRVGRFGFPARGHL